MCSPRTATGQLVAGLDALASTDMVTLADQTLREQLLDLVIVVNRAQAELVRRVDAFDQRGLSALDGFRSARSWLQAFGRLSGVVAHRVVKAARTLRRLPKLAMAAQSGDVSPEHVQQVARLVDQVGAADVAEVDATLADAARQLDVARFSTVCDRVRAYLDPDGPDPAGDFDKRNLTLSPAQGMMVMRGQLDAEGGSALATALDALMTPPADGDQRTPAQRRADALVELAHRHLTAGTLPTVGGQRPQVGVLLYPQSLSPETLAKLAEVHRDDLAGRRFADLLAKTGAEKPNATTTQTPDGEIPNRQTLDPTATRTSDGKAPDREPPAGGATRTPDGKAPDREATAVGATAAQRPAWSEPGWTDPPWLNWVGPVSPVVAQRIACDSDIWRIILDPATGSPLDVGRAYRLVPHWIRKALYARDRGCRWPGCATPAEWTDGHHIEPWAEGGETRIDRCLLLCRYHHGLVHEGGWSIDLDPATGEATVTRPGGIPFRVPRTRSPSWNGPTTHVT